MIILQPLSSAPTPPTPPLGYTFFIELAGWLDVPIDGNDDATDVERRLAEALYLHIKNGAES